MHLRRDNRDGQGRIEQSKIFVVTVTPRKILNPDRIGCADGRYSSSPDAEQPEVAIQPVIRELSRNPVILLLDR